MILVKIIKQYTHKKINKELCGIPIELGEGYSKVKLKLISDMIVDKTGLIHGGFVFSLADYAAMLAINHPNTILGGANVRFLKPVLVDENLIAEAKFMEEEGKKQLVKVSVKRDGEIIFTGEFICFSPDHHITEGDVKN
jgi:uncharacterized protein (TIGR00369 family)